MKPRWIPVALAALLAVVAACTGSPGSCEVCKRTECGNLGFTIAVEGGKRVDTCCPRCGLHYIATERPTVASLRVRDFDTASSLNAHQAYFVDGSDVTPCANMGGSPPMDARGCCMKPVYDRCLPSLVAFETRARAEAFAKEHGGTVRTFAEVGGGS